jgi:hypothetical protein
MVTVIQPSLKFDSSCIPISKAEALQVNTFLISSIIMRMMGVSAVK